MLSSLEELLHYANGGRYLYDFKMNSLSVSLFSNQLELIYLHIQIVSSIAIYSLHSRKCFSAFQFNTNNSI